MEKLARELAKSPELLAQHLKQLVEMDGRRLFEFGEKYGEISGNRAVTGRIVRAQLKVNTPSSMRFLAGYMTAIKASDAEGWDQTVLGLLGDPSQRLVAQAIVSIGFSPAVLDAALALIPGSEIPSSFFRPLIFDAYREQLDAGLVGRVVTALTSNGTPDASHMAIELADRFYCQAAQPKAFHDERVMERLLLGSAMSPESDQTMHWYHWKRVTEEFCRRFPEREMAVFKAFLAHLDDVEVGDRKEIGQVAWHITQRRPSEVWPLVSKALEDDLNDTYGIRSWIGGGPRFAHRPGIAPIIFFDPDIVIEWALQNCEPRRYLIQGMLPKTLADQGGGQLTRAFIDKLMQDNDEGYGLISHFQMGGWTGPRSGHLRGLRDQARSWLSDSNSPNVARWLAKYLGVLGEEIDRAEIDEERRGY